VFRNSSIGYRALFDKLTKVRQWYDSLNISTEGVNFELICCYVKKITDAFHDGSLQQLLDVEGGRILHYALTESMAFVDIHEAYSLLSQDHLPKQKLKSILNIPVFPADEISGEANVNERNAMFELELASKFIKGGVSDVVDHDDFSFLFNGEKVHIECKRIFSAKQVNSKVSAAFSKLACKINEHQGRGIVALSIEKLINVSDEFFNSRDAQHIHDILTSKVEDFRRNYSRFWERLDHRVIGIVLVAKFNTVNLSENRVTNGYHIECSPLASPMNNQMKDYNLFRDVCSCLNRSK